MDNTLQQPGYGLPPTARRPSPYDQPDSRRQSIPPRRALPSDPPVPPPKRNAIQDPYHSAFDLLQSHRPGGTFYPEAHMTGPNKAPEKLPEIVSPRPQRLTPSMPANLAQNLDQMTSKMKNESAQTSQAQSSQPDDKSTVGRPISQELPPLKMPKQVFSDASPDTSPYSISSGVESYLSNDFFPTQATQPSEPAYKAYNAPTQPPPPIPKKEPYNPPPPPPQTAPQPARNEPYNTYQPPPPPPQTAPQPARNEPYNAYQPPPQQQYAPAPLAPLGDPPRPQSQGRSQYPPPPSMRDYSRPAQYAPPSSAPQQSYSQQYQGPDPSRQSNVPPQGQYQPAKQYGGSAPYPQDSSIPDAPIAPFHNMSLNEALQPPSRPSSQTGRQSPRLSGTTAAQRATSTTPPSLIPLSEAEWEQEIDSQRETALNTNDPNVGLTWAEKVYMYVSISLEELQREQDIAASDAGVVARPSTPAYERGLRDDCVRVVEKFAKNGSGKANYIRGIWYEYGDFKYPSDRHEAFHAYQSAIKQGYHRAEYRLGKMYEDVGDMKRGMYHYGRGVTQGDSASLYRVGMVNLLGQKGYPVNLPEAIKLLFQAAGSADIDAPQGAYVFALLLTGELSGVTIPETILPRDEKGARRLLEKASSLGFSNAQQRLGNAHENGTWGCGYDPALSLHYYKLAAKQGDPEAMMGLSKWYLCGSEAFPPNEEKAFYNAELAAKMGLPQAEFAMGYFYEVGIGVTVDLEKADSWYRMAAEHGNQDAIQRRGGISRKQTLSRKDHEAITQNIRSARLKKGQKAPKPPPTQPPTAPLPQQFSESYPTDPPVRTQSPAGRQRITSGPPVPADYRRSSGTGPPSKQEYRHSSYASYNAPDPQSRKSSAGSGAPISQSMSQPSLAELGNVPHDGYTYSAPVRPSSRPSSQASSPPPLPSSRPSTAETFGLGPKTFQEMGVTTIQKKDSDCLIM